MTRRPRDGFATTSPGRFGRFVQFGLTGTRVLAGTTALVACACLPPEYEGTAGALSDATAPRLDLRDLPGGFGSLTQNDITVALQLGAVQVALTPLDPWVVRLTAPDTWRRLEGLHDQMQRTLGPGQRLMLLSFFTEAAGGAEIDPFDVSVAQRGRRLRPVDIAGLGATWGDGLLQPRETAQAVYAFDGGLDTMLPFEVIIGGRTSRQWELILPRLEAEAGRVRSRAQSSRSNFLILR